MGGARPFRRHRPHSELLFFGSESFSHTVQSVPTCSPTEQKHQAETKGMAKSCGRCLTQHRNTCR